MTSIANTFNFVVSDKPCSKAVTQPFFQVSSCLASSIVMAVAFVLAIMCAQALLSLHLVRVDEELGLDCSGPAY